MKQEKGLVILHIDGLGHHYLIKALEQGRMPFVQHLLQEEGYEVLRYRCGLPSTTPFCQAGILYGDNTEIPSFRWWDKQSGLFVSFGGFSSFKHVEQEYFQKCEPLTLGGAAIATCYPGASRAAFRIGYREHGHSLNRPSFSNKRVLANWALNPLNLSDWLRRGLWQISNSNLNYWRTRLAGKPAAKMYVVSDMLEEILMHQFTRYAVQQAMTDGYPMIYGAFYAYDETAHAFGPESDYSFRILRHIDNTIRRIAGKRDSPYPAGRDYEMVIHSDHGQVETVPYERAFGKRLGDWVAEWLPTFEIEKIKGKRVTRKEAIDGHLVLAYLGGLAHIYFKDISWRLEYDEIEERFPGLVEKIAAAPGIGFILLRDNTHDLIITKDVQFRLNGPRPLPRAIREFLGQFDVPEIVAGQLHKLNSFDRSGDLILFGAFSDHHQINFEDQVGGHGSLGGEQLFPFMLAKREWRFKTDDIVSASDVYPLLRQLRDACKE